MRKGAHQWVAERLVKELGLPETTREELVAACLEPDRATGFPSRAFKYFSAACCEWKLEG
jgi:hypothetical protein